MFSVQIISSFQADLCWDVTTPGLGEAVQLTMVMQCQHLDDCSCLQS